MGLCMGFSFVSAAEIIYYLALSLLNLCRSKSEDQKGNEDSWATKRNEEH